jgi:hypothetical protein
VGIACLLLIIFVVAIDNEHAGKNSHHSMFFDWYKAGNFRNKIVEVVVSTLEQELPYNQQV